MKLSKEEFNRFHKELKYKLVDLEQEEREDLSKDNENVEDMKCPTDRNLKQNDDSIIL